MQFVELRLTIERVEAMSDKQLATAFLMEKPKIESDRTLELELMLPDLVTRLKNRGVTKGMIYRHYISQSTDGFKHAAFLVRLNTYMGMSGKSTSIYPIPPRRFKRKNEWAVGVSLAVISISFINSLNNYFHF